MKRLKFLMMTPCRVNVGSSSQIYTRSVFPFLATAYPDEGERVLVGVIFKEGYFSLLCYFLLNETFLGLSSPLLTQQVDRRKRDGGKRFNGVGREKGREKKNFHLFLSLSLPNQRKGNIRQVFCVAAPVKVERERKEI